MSRRVLLLCLEPDEFTEADISAIRSMAPEYELLATSNAEEIRQRMQEIEVAVGSCPPELILEMPQLRWYQQWGAGADWLQKHPEAQEHPFQVTTVSGVHSIPISEHILAFLLAFARAFPKAFAYQRAKQWTAPGWDDVFELAGKTMLVLGLGAIGARTAQIASALGVHVIGIRRSQGDSLPGVATIYTPDEMLELLPRADFVVITLPLTPETQDLIGEPELRAMKSSAYIINIGRGGIINEAALVRALQQGQIAGAGLDVFAEEPLPAGSPLWEMENVIITCHYSGQTPVYDARAFTIFLDNLRRYQSGETLRNIVDKSLGY
jgi:D-2-hydroxyacid dehydrogenase (NADP+)